MGGMFGRGSRGRNSFTSVRARRIAVGGIAVAALLVAAGCSPAGSKNSSSSSSATSTSAAPAGSSPSSAGPSGSTGGAAAATAEAASSSAPATSAVTFVVARTGDIDKLDPHKATAFQTVETLSLVYSRLVATDQDGKIVPDLATKWDTSADGKTVTFTLRTGVTWQDGDPFTSADVKASIARILDQKTGCRRSLEPQDHRQRGRRRYRSGRAAPVRAVRRSALLAGLGELGDRVTRRTSPPVRSARRRTAPARSPGGSGTRASRSC